jgi:TolB-like protein/DNA-binding winged helix-turn-helix (wHTH) protein
MLFGVSGIVLEDSLNICPSFLHLIMSFEDKCLAEFGPYRLDLRRRILTRDNKIVPLPLKDIDTLIVLVRSHGQLVEKQALMDMVWPATFVEEANISRHIFNIRQTLEKGKGSQEYIQTVPKRGYRFVGAVKFLNEIGSGAKAGEPKTVLLLDGSPRRRASDLSLQTSTPHNHLEQPSAPAHAQQRAKPGRSLAARWVFTGIFVFVLLSAALLLRHRTLAGPMSTRHKVMIAVLPVENLSGDSSKEYLSDGLTEEFIAQLGAENPQQLGVIARTSSMTYKHTNKTVDQIGRELGVDYVLESSFRGSANHLRVTAQLIRVPDQVHVWAKQYDRESQDLITLDDDIGWSVAHQVEIQLAPTSRAEPAARQPQNAEAYQLYLKARYAWNKRSRAGLEESLDYFRQAILKDPNDARSYVGMADAHNMLLFYGYERGSAAIQNAREAAQKSIEIDHNLAEGHAALAYVDFWWLSDWPGAEREFRRSIELDPNYVSGHHWYALYLAAMGRHSEAVDEIKMAETLDPRSLIVKSAAGFIYYFGRQPQLALQECDSALAIDPDFMVAHAVRGLAFEEEGSYEHAIGEFQKALAMSNSRSATYITYLGHAYAAAGRRSDAAATLNELDLLSQGGYPVANDKAIIYTALGERENAIKELRRSESSHDANIAWLGVSPQFDPLRSDPRYGQILAAFNFPSGQ